MGRGPGRKNCSAKGEIKIRQAVRKNLVAEVQLVNKIYNECWSGNWGYVPMTEKEILKVAHELYYFLDTDLIFFLYIDQEPIGVSLVLPDINPPLQAFQGLGRTVGPTDEVPALVRCDRTPGIHPGSQGKISPDGSAHGRLPSSHENAGQKRQLPLHGIRLDPGRQRRYQPAVRRRRSDPPPVDSEFTAKTWNHSGTSIIGVLFCLPSNMPKKDCSFNH